MFDTDKAAPPVGHSVPRWDRNAIAPAALVIGDIFALGLAAFLGYASRRALSSYFPIQLNFESSAGVFVCLAAIPFGLWLANLYPGIGLPTVERLRRRTLVTLSIFLVMIVFAFLVGLEAGSLRRWKLSRGKWRQLDVVSAKTEEDAERRFFDRQAAAPPERGNGTPNSPMHPLPRASLTPQTDVVGFFPEPGAPR